MYIYIYIYIYMYIYIYVYIHTHVYIFIPQTPAPCTGDGGVGAREGSEAAVGRVEEARAGGRPHARCQVVWRHHGGLWLLPILFDTMYLSISLRKSTPPQNCRLNILISNSKRYDLTRAVKSSGVTMEVCRPTL